MPTIRTDAPGSMKPRIERREERYYLSILACVRQAEIPAALPGLWQDVVYHLATRAMRPSGCPFVRHVLTRADTRVELEAAVPVADPVRGNRHIRTGIMPAGSYAVVRHAGTLQQLLEAQDALIAWGEECDVAWDAWPMDGGIAWGGRMATFATIRRHDPGSPRIEAELECRIRLPAAHRPGSSRRLRRPSKHHQGSSQNDFAAARPGAGSRR